MTRKIVSEKTLELNLCASILAMIRTWPGCSGAFWIGMKQDQEFRNGIDELISNVPSGRHLALQFKAPSRDVPDGIPYGFGIGAAQNAALLPLARVRPASVFYVFPHYNTFNRMRGDAPGLDAHTYLLPVAATAPVVAAHTHKHHTVESFESPPHVLVHSESFDLKTRSLREFMGGHRTRPRGDDFLTGAQVLSWLDVLALSNADDRPRARKKRVAATGQYLRGFRTVFLPFT